LMAALIAALPTAASVSYLILALEHPPAFVAASALGSMAANAAVAVFALSYAALAQRHGIVLSITAATLVWFAIAAILRLFDWTPATALTLNALVFAVTIPLSARYRAARLTRESLTRTGYDLPLRAAAAAVAVTAVTTTSQWIGSFASGVFAVFPIVMGSVAVIMHSRAGGKAAASVFCLRAAAARWPLPGISRRALPRRGDRRVVGSRGRPRHHHDVERRALAHAACVICLSLASARQ